MNEWKCGPSVVWAVATRWQDCDLSFIWNSRPRGNAEKNTLRNAYKSSGFNDIDVNGGT